MSLTFDKLSPEKETLRKKRSIFKDDLDNSNHFVILSVDSIYRQRVLTIYLTGAIETPSPTTFTCVGRDAGAGRQWGQLAPPPRLGSFGSFVHPQLWTLDVVHFYFCSFLHVNLGPFQKNSGPNLRSF